jgi:hypothetical protein
MTRVTHPVREVAPAILIFDIREAISYQRRLYSEPTASCGKLLFDPQQIIDGVQNCVLPLDVIPEPEDLLSRASIKYSERRDWNFLARDDRQPSLQLWPRLSDELYRLLPCKPARRDDEPFRLVRRGWNLECEDVCPRHITHVDVQRRSAERGIVPADGTVGCASDEPVDELVRARCGRVVDLA